MARSLSLSTIMLIALALAGNAVAIPTAESYPEVVPGPGLPSLESLGLTSADLHKMGYESQISRREPNPLLVPRYKLNCLGKKCQANDAVACINYLARLGNRPCAIVDNSLHEQVMCMSGTARIKAHQLVSGAVSSCNDLARGGGYIMDSCTHAGLVSGNAPAYGNGNFIADIALIGTNQ